MILILVIFLRTLVLYILVILAIRFMGKRQVGQLQPAELVIAIMISDLASIPIESSNTPILYGVIPIFTLIGAELLLSWFCLKNNKFRRLLSGESSILIYKGKILEDELKKQRFNLEDLLEELRQNNIPDISQVDYAILETSGQVSVIPKASAQPLTPADLNIIPNEKNYPCTIISDGILNADKLKRSGKTKSWLNSQLKKNNINKIEDVFIATITCEGNLFIQKKKGKPQKRGN